MNLKPGIGQGVVHNGRYFKNYQTSQKTLED